MSSNESYSIHVEETQHTVPQNSHLLEHFYINLHHFHSNSLSSYFFIIPRNILCAYDDFEAVDPDSFTSTYLHDHFSNVPISSEVLDETLLLMSDSARYMNMVERYSFSEMDVFIRTTSNEGTNVDDQNASLTTILSLLEKVKLEDITCSMEQCAICLEEFCNESELEIVRTKCMHVFHEHCIAQWLKQCHITNRLYSCPLCRLQIQ